MTHLFPIFIAYLILTTVTHLPRPQAEADAMVAILLLISSLITDHFSQASWCSWFHSARASRHLILPRVRSTLSGFCSCFCSYALRARGQSCNFSYQPSWIFYNKNVHLKIIQINHKILKEIYLQQKLSLIMKWVYPLSNFVTGKMDTWLYRCSDNERS